MPDKSLVTHYFPDFLKMDLQVGEARPHPLANALDDFSRAICWKAYELALSVQANLLPESTQRQFLRRFGFRLDTLNAEQTARFFSASSQLFDEVNTLPAISLLATLYFGTATVQRGYPYPSHRIADNAYILLNDGLAKQSILFVRTQDKAPLANKVEFIFNAERLIPEGFQVVVADPLQKPLARPHGMDLKNGFLLNEIKLD